MSEPASLPDDLATAHRMLREQADTIRQQQHLIERMQHQLEQLLRQRYGKKSETLDPNQGVLFELETAPPTAPPPAPSQENKPKQPGHGRNKLPASLPRVEVVHDLSDEQKRCPECGEERRGIGEEQREQLDYIPASLHVVVHKRRKYACKACQGQVAIAPRWPEPIEKGLPGNGLLAHVIVSKYADHLPLNRLEGIFKRHGVSLSRQTMCDWMATCAHLLQPLVQAMKRRIVRSRVVQTDDTPVPVQDPGRKQTKTGRLWVYLGDEDHPFIIYDYTADRCRDGPEKFLSDYKSGYLQSDAYSGYDRIHARGVVEVGCWAHARRKFYDARTTDAERAHQVLAWIGQTYEVEREASDRGLDQDARHALRQEQSRPILERLFEWLETEKPKVLPKSPLGQAIGYTWSNWTALNRYLEAGFLNIDNNASERALRPIAVGRNNWIFCGSDRGGRTAAVLLSLVHSCKRLGVEPFGYLRDVLARVNTHPASRIAELLPDEWPKRFGPSSKPNPDA